MNTEIESERINKIAVLEADIRAIKAANGNWAHDAGDKAAIASINQRLAVLEQPGKIPPNPTLSLMIFILFLFCSMFHHL